MEEGDGKKANQDLPNATDGSAKVDETATPQPQPPTKSEAEGGGGGGGWGGWGFSVFSDLQKAAEEISRNAVAVAKSAITEIQTENTEAEKEKEKEKEEGEEETDEEKDRLRKAALDKLENASQDTILGQGLKVIDSSVESLASGTWTALGNAWKGSTLLVQKLENSASNLAGSIQQGGLPVKASSLAPSLLETGRSFTAKGMEVLERVGKETMELLIEETGLQLEKNSEGDVDHPHIDEEQLEEDVTFDRCFYIYGGPDQLEELEALSSHYAVLFNRRKAKLLSEQKQFYEAKLKEIQELFNLERQLEGNGQDSAGKGKEVEAVDSNGDIEIRKLCDSSVTKAASMAAGFTSALGGLAANEIIQKTTDRLESIHSEGVHRLSELCCLAVSQLLLLGKSVISKSSKANGEETDEDIKIEWPEDLVSKANIIRSKAQFMSSDVIKVSSSFITGISDIIEAYIANQLPEQKTVQTKANEISNKLRSDQTDAIGKIQDVLHHLTFVVLSTSMPTA
ncbi:BAT2 domain protein [Rhynchospora pubera]|uniref:BAT2 domain protein n=1 Tax=Rhynchospora pubera TaxID=906938 RepID=A0AAV8HB36_9POAL|nr:BAT2 domain protein [Rhynchospora pubera]